VSDGLVTWLLIGWAALLLTGGGMVGLGAALEARLRRKERR
jgi:hypothetical protein